MMCEIQELTVYELLLNLGLQELLVEQNRDQNSPKGKKVPQKKFPPQKNRQNDMSHIIKRVPYPFNQIKEKLFGEILYQVICLESLEAFLEEFGRVLGAR